MSLRDSLSNNQTLKSLVTNNSEFRLLTMFSALLSFSFSLYFSTGNGLILGLTSGSSLLLPQNISADLGKSFNVPLILNPNGRSVVGLDFRIQFSTQNLVLEQILPSTNLPTTVTYTPQLTQAVSNANSTGFIDFSMLAYDATTQAVTAPLAGNSQLQIATLVFRPVLAGNTPLTIQFSPDATTDSNVSVADSPSDALYSVANSIVAVLAPTPTPTPTPTSTPTPTPNPSGTPAPTPTPTALLNAGFEAGSLSGWKVNSGTSVNTSGRTGNNSAKLTNTNAYVSQDIAALLKPNVSYTFSSWVKVTTSGTGWGKPSLRVGKYEDLGTADYGQAQAAKKSSKDWAELKVTKSFTAQNLSGPVYFGLVNFGFNGVALVDDFAINTVIVTPTPTLTPTPTPTVTPTPTPAPTPTATPTPVPTAQTITLNAQLYSQDGSNGSTPTWIGNGASETSSYLGMRFANVSIPKGATINSAKLELKSASTQWISIDLDLFSENSSNSNSFSSSALPGSRALSSDKIGHSSNTSWNSGVWYSLEDVKSLISAVTARSDWSTGNNLSIIAKGTGGAYARKFISDAKITITFTP